MKKNIKFEDLICDLWFEEFREYNECGKVIHSRDYFCESWYEYDAYGNLIHSKTKYMPNISVERVICHSQDRWNQKFQHKEGAIFGNVINSQVSDAPFEEWFEYDEKGRLLHKRDSLNYEEWTEYDAEGRMTHSRNSYGHEECTEYTSDGIKWYEKRGGNSKEEEFCNYNLDGFPVWYKRIYPTGYTEEEVYKYDSTWRTCTVREINGKRDDKVLKFDEAGNCIYCEDDYTCRHWMEYDAKGRQIYGKDQRFVGEDDFSEWWKKFDEKGNCIYRKDTAGREKWMKYDERGNCTYCKDTAGFEQWMKYDERGNLIYSKDSNGSEMTFKTEYDSNGNLILHGDTKYENTYWPDGKTLKMTRVIG